MTAEVSLWADCLKPVSSLNQFLDRKLKHMGFTSLPGDPCVYSGGKGDIRTSVCLRVAVNWWRVLRRRRERRPRGSPRARTLSSPQERTEALVYRYDDRQGGDGHVVSRERYRKELSSNVRHGHQAEGVRISSRRLRAGRAVDRQGRGVLQGKVSKHDDVGDARSQTRADVLFPAVYLTSRSHRPIQNG